VRIGVTLSAGVTVAACFFAIMNFEAGKKRETSDPLIRPPEAGKEGQRAHGAEIDHLNEQQDDATSRATAAVSDVVRGQPVDERPDQLHPSVRPEELPQPKNRAFEVIRQTFLSQERDSRWSTAMESRIFQQIANSSTTSGFIDIQAECRTTLCRVQLSFAGETQEDLLPYFSVTATMHGYRLRSSIGNDLGLDALAFDSGFVSTIPMSLLYLQREAPSTTTSESP
jgi:hypothetical protein